jgi:hypothetical protein
MSHWAEEHKVVGRAAAAQPESTRGPHMVELKPTKAVVGDPEAPEYAATVPFPDVGPHDRRDRIWPACIAAPVLGRVPTEHQSCAPLARPVREGQAA